MNNTSFLPAVVTIVDLTPATTITGATLFEAVQTTSGVAESVAVSLAQIMTTGFGALPVGGSTGQFLQKLSGTNFASAWTNISSAVLASTGGGLTIVGSTTINLSLNTATPLSVLGVAGTSTAVPLPIVSSGGGQLLQSNAGNTGLLFGPISTTLLPGPFQTSTLPVNQVLFGNGTSPIFGVTGATSSILNVLNGTAVFTPAPVIGTSLTVPLVIGGTGSASSIIIESTSGTGTSDSIKLRTGTQTFALGVNTLQQVTIGPDMAPSTAVLLTLNANTTAPQAPSFGGTVLQLVGMNGTSTRVSFDVYGSAVNGSFQFRVARGTLQAPLAVSTASVIGALLFNYYDGTGYNSTDVGAVLAFSGNTISTTSHPTGIRFNTIPENALVAVNAVTINPSGGFNVGTTAEAGFGNIQNTGKIQVGSGTGVVAGGTTSVGFFLSSVANLGFIAGTSAPTVSAATGTLYINNGATNATSRLYINTNGTGGWANFTASA